MIEFAYALRCSLVYSDTSFPSLGGSKETAINLEDCFLKIYTYMFFVFFFLIQRTEFITGFLFECINGAQSLHTHHSRSKFALPEKFTCAQLRDSVCSSWRLPGLQFPLLVKRLLAGGSGWAAPFAFLLQLSSLLLLRKALCMVIATRHRMEKEARISGKVNQEKYSCKAISQGMKRPLKSKKKHTGPQEP